ncbi:hypothetical protein MMC14_002221 [Varicellaria rhodocarpa]|nr:hypothetical protein [Varicellaria rhodocarpa]
MQSDLTTQPVSRVELYEGFESPDLHPADTEIQDKLRRQFEREFLASVATQDSGINPVQEPADYEFRLFTNSVDVPTRINIRSPTPTAGGPGFIQPRRADSYYFRNQPNSQELAQFQGAAVSGDDVIAELQRRWPGRELPWRVTTIKVKAQGKQLVVQPEVHSRQSQKKRVGKKRRTAIRKKRGLLERQKAQVSVRQAEKEAAEREKRTRRNREKKVKKKEKDKAKKSEKEGVDV